MTAAHRSALADTLNQALGLSLRSFEDAKAWLGSGGWDALDQWLAGHHDEHEDESAA